MGLREPKPKPPEPPAEPKPEEEAKPEEAAPESPKEGDVADVD